MKKSIRSLGVKVCSCSCVRHTSTGASTGVVDDWSTGSEAPSPLCESEEEDEGDDMFVYCVSVLAREQRDDCEFCGE